MVSQRKQRERVVGYHSFHVGEQYVNKEEDNSSHSFFFNFSLNIATSLHFYLTWIMFFGVFRLSKLLKITNLTLKISMKHCWSFFYYRTKCP